MKHVYISRAAATDQGTPGRLFADGFTSDCIELPWRDNLSGKSCIPPGDYLCRWLASPHFNRDLYHVLDVPGRDAIEVHPANFAGDVSMGFKCELRGCFALGEAGTLEGQLAVLHSKDTVARFEQLMEGQDFMLHVAWVPGCEPYTGAIS